MLGYLNVKYRKSILLVAFALCHLSLSAQQTFAVKNNLVYDATLTPNLGLEFKVDSLWTVGLNAGYRPWPTDDNVTRKWRHLLVAPEVRRWKRAAFHGRFWGANVIYSHYNVANLKFPLGLYPSVRHQRKQGDLIALGLFYGHSWRLSSHWNVEAFAGAAVGHTWYKTHECRRCGMQIEDTHKWFAMPQLGLNVVYRFGREPERPRPVPADNVVPDVPQPVPTPVTEEPAKPLVPVEQPVVKPQPVPQNDTLYVYFALNSAVVNPAFHNNQATLQRLVDVSKLTDRLTIVGMASIDGNPQRNATLARQRAEALKQYVVNNAALSADRISTSGEGEAWTLFEAQVRKANFKGRDEVLRILDTIKNARLREVAIKALHGGATYRYLKEQLLSDERYASCVVIYKR